MKGKCAKRKLAKKLLSLVLVLVMCVGLLPVQTLAEEKSYEVKANEVVWKMQQFGQNTDLEIQEGWLTPDEEGEGFMLDYGKLYTDRGNSGSVIIYNSEAPVYQESILEMDVTVTGGREDRFQIGFFPRFQDGKNCDGFAIDAGASTQHSFQVKGSEGWPGVTNELGKSFGTGETYHLKLVTEGSTITVYLIEGGTAKKLSSFETKGEITEGRYGFRIWGQEPVRKVHIGNITWKKCVVSSVNDTGCTLDASEWGTKDVEIPVTFGEGDGVTSIKNGNTVLTADTDYTVQADKVVLKKEYIVKQTENFVIQILFEGGTEGNYSVLKKMDSFLYVEDFFDNDAANWEKVSGNGSAVLENGALHVKGNTVLVDKASPMAQDGEAEFEIETLNDNGNFGLVFRAGDDGTWHSFYNNNSCVYQYAFSKWNFATNSSSKEVLTDGTNILKRSDGTNYTMKVRFIGQTLTVWMDGNPIYCADLGQMALRNGHIGIQTGNNAEILLKKVTYRSCDELAASEETGENVSISKDGFKVNLAKDFPRVINYELDGKTLDGCVIPKNYVSVNGTDYPASATVTAAEDTVTYAVAADLDGKQTVNFNVVFTAKENNVLDMQITDVQENGCTVYTLNLPEQPLISAKKSDKDAAFNLSTGSSDVNVKLTDGNGVSKTVVSYANIPIITANGLSASMTNNVYNNRKEFSYKSFDFDGDVTTGVWNTDFYYRGVDGKRLIPEGENPYCQVVVTGDTGNGDDTVNWQDGANALKKYLIGDKINGADKVRNSMIHVGYNFVSEAQQPFLKVADNYKRLGNLMDGFDQIAVLKGYANEGHDSGHADYADISKRGGGAEDLIIMSQAIADAGLGTFGVHINHSEAYPEAVMFNSEVMSTINGWKWMDQSKYIRREVDIANGGMDSRLNEMFAKASDNGKTPGIGFVYVDTYRDDRYAAARLANNIVGQHGAILGTEEGGKLDRWTAWVHGPANMGEIHRFVYNSQKDVYQDDGRFWGGYNRSTSMMSWQHNWNINNVLSQFYTSQLPQKYLMNHEVILLADGYAYFEGNVKSKDHQIWKDDKLVVGNGGYFVPWYGEDSETKNPDEAVKIYYWCDGGTKTWDLPNEEWAALASVKLYKNTQTGKEFVKDLQVKDGQVTIDGVSANTPYVVYPGEAVPENTEWSTGSPIKDTGFNSRDFSIWEKSGEANIQFNDDSNGVSILTMEGKKEGAVSQIMTGLVPGQKYRAVVWAGVENGKTARITVETPDGKTYENYVDQIVRANDCFDTYAKGKRVERVWVDFVQPEGETTATITFSADACEKANGKATFMESRIVKTAEPDFPSTDAKKYVANETFEYVEQGGTGIFTPEGGGDGGYHLSHYTEYTDDAININGEWSLKMYGSGSANMRTYPATMRLEPNTEYTMEFDALGNGTVMVVSEAVSSDKPMSESFLEGHSKFTFTTGERADYIVRFEGGRNKVLDNFEMYTLQDLTPPTVPENVTAVVENDTQVRLTWDTSVDEDTSVSRYIVYRDGEKIGTTKTTEFVDDKTEEETTYQYEVSAVNATNVESTKSEAVTATTGTDSIAPELLSGKLVNQIEILLQFSEALEETSALDTRNYKVSNSVNVTKAELQKDQKSVLLTVENVPTDKVFTVQAAGIKDASKNVNVCVASKVIELSAMIRYYKFDETDTTTAVDFMGNEDGKKVGTVSLVDGVNGKAAGFNNSKVEISKNALYDVEEWTVSQWINWKGVTGESQTIWANAISGNAGASGVWFHIRNDKKIWVSPWANGGKDFTSKNTVPENEWIHVALTKDKGGKFTLYVNGEESVSGTFANFPTNIPNDFHIGSNYNGGSGLLHKFNGSMDEFKIHNILLNADQIKTMASDTEFLPSLAGDGCVVDKADLKDVVIKMDANMYQLSGISLGGTALGDTDYVFENDILVIKKEFLATLEAKEHELSIAFTQEGKDEVVLSYVLDVRAEEADKTDLEALIDYAKSQKEDKDYPYVIPVVKNAFEAALAEAVAVNENGAATQVKVDAAYNKLLKMVHYLGFIGNSESLSTLVVAARGLNEKLYTAESWALFADAWAKAEEVLAEENSLQAEIDVATEVLQKAMGALEKITVNKEKLQKLVDKSKKHQDVIADYTSETAGIFTGAFTHACGILEKEDVTQEEIDAAYTALQNAIFGLRLLPNKDKLEGLIKDAEAVDTANYTVKSATAFAAALDNAKAVFADGEATEEEVKSAEKALEEAQKNLVGKADVDKKADKEAGNKTDNKAAGKVASDDGNKKEAFKSTVKTGDAVQTTVVMMIMLMAGAAAVVSIRRKVRR